MGFAHTYERWRAIALLVQEMKRRGADCERIAEFMASVREAHDTETIVREAKRAMRVEGER